MAKLGRRASILLKHPELESTSEELLAYFKDKTPEAFRKVESVIKDYNELYDEYKRIYSRLEERNEDIGTLQQEVFGVQSDLAAVESQRELALSRQAEFAQQNVDLRAAFNLYKQAHTNLPTTLTKKDPPTHRYYHSSHQK